MIGSVEKLSVRAEGERGWTAATMLRLRTSITETEFVLIFAFAV